MANTEGMPDEFVESLMTTTSNSNSKSNMTAKESAAERQRRRIEERMERMSFNDGDGGDDGGIRQMRGQPSARIIRASPQQINSNRSVHFEQGLLQKNPSSSARNTSLAQTQDDPLLSSLPQSSTPMQSNTNHHKPILGNILERTPSRTTTAKHRNPKKLPVKNSTTKLGGVSGSRFAQRQHNSSSTTGFPSVHVPLGTFCKAPGTRLKTGKTVSSSVSNSFQTKPLVQSKQSTDPSKINLHNSSSLNGSKDTDVDSRNITMDSLLKASRRDAHGMLQGMTETEIRQEQAELKQALSPDMIAFLKRRQKTKKQQENQSNSSNSDYSKETDQVNQTNSAATMKDNIGKKAIKDADFKLSKQQQQKERMAELISNVKTHQDLDQAYQQFMQEPHPLQQQPTTNDDKSGINANISNTSMHNNDHEIDSSLHTSNRQDGKGKTVIDDFAVACDLLRSTNARQTVWAARIVQRHLSKLAIERRSHESVAYDWPLVLPVSLRCLLDQPVQPNTGFILHTFVLQSLYCLLQLTAHPDHCVSITPNIEDNANQVFVDCCLEDAVPTPRLDSMYSADTIQPIYQNDGVSKVGETEAAAYATNSSSSSAQSDGEAFEKDPMWTLLSKMKIVPRTAQLLFATLEHEHYDWPPEAFLALFGILSMIAQRSPGAASAMVHHEQIMPQIVRRILPILQQNDEVSNDQKFVIVYAAFRFFVILARQSRMVAEALPLAEILPPLLAIYPANDLEFRVQQMGLQLWRSVLRYGLGLGALEAMTTAAARHLALPYTYQYSLSVEYISAMSQVLELAKIALLKAEDLAELPTEKLPPSMSLLSSVKQYISSMSRTMLLEPTTCCDPSNEILCFRWGAARMRFLSNYWSFIDIREDVGEEKSGDSRLEETLSTLEAMDEWSDDNNLISKAWAYFCTSAIWTRSHTEENQDNEHGASASAFLDAYVQLLLSIENSDVSRNNRIVSELCRSISKRLSRRILNDLSITCQKEFSEDNTNLNVPLAKQGWLNRGHFAASKVLSHSHKLGDIDSLNDLSIVRILVVLLLGRLQRGDESMAVVLFSQDYVFQTQGDSASAISSLFIGELCGSKQSRKQMDHSFKLNHGFGITQDGLGSFGLDSLLSNSDQPRLESSKDLSLPLGKAWLWQCLSGQIHTKEETAIEKGFIEAKNVLYDTLRLLLDMDTPKNQNQIKGASLGTKVYHLMNVCLQIEEVLQDDQVLTLSDTLLDIYLNQLESNNNLFISGFADACLRHSDPNYNDGEELAEKDKKLLDFFDPYVAREELLTKRQVRALEAFLDDLTEAYQDYGAQYGFFTKCIRLFLLPVFPYTLRSRAIKDLRGVMHLLTLPQELENFENLADILRLSVVDGRDENIVRDPPEFLDGVAKMMASNACPQPLDGFALAFSIIVMTRNVMAAKGLGKGLDSMKKRIRALDPSIAGYVLFSLEDLKGKVGKEDLVMSALKSLSGMSGSSLVIEEGDIDKRIENLEIRFQN